MSGAVQQAACPATDLLDEPDWDKPCLPEIAMRT